MEQPSAFNDFLTAIRPTADQLKDCRIGHTTLRQRLEAYEELSSIYLTSFLQGSYVRSTAVRPIGDGKLDVDIIVVTNLDKDKVPPAQALKTFEPFVKRYYEGQYRIQGRSIGISLSYVDLDLVVTAAPNEAYKPILHSESVATVRMLEEAMDWKLALAADESEWKSQPLFIADREACEWTRTDPLAQKQWTRDKNLRCGGHFVNIVRALKWWRLTNYTEPKHPKSYPLERIIGECCPDGITSIAKGVALTLEAILERFELDVLTGEQPTLPDYGVPEHNVLKRITPQEFAEFYDQVKEGAAIAREALECQEIVESAKAWRRLLGTKFPEPPVPVKTSTGFTAPLGAATVSRGRFA